MKNLIIVLLFSLVLSSCEKTETQLCGLPVADSSSSRSLKGLFLGNSLTYFNNLAYQVEWLARSNGDYLSSDTYAPGGYWLEAHSRISGFKIRSRQWDCVILQESPHYAAQSDAFLDTMVYPYVDSLKRMILENNPETEIVLYMAPAHKNGIENCDEVQTACTYDGMQERIKNTHIVISDRLGIKVAPAGIIWQIFMDKYPDIELFNDDGVHPNPLGTYLIACTVYSTIYRKKPIGIYVPDNVAIDDADKVQRLVSDILFDCNPNWRNYS